MYWYLVKIVYRIYCGDQETVIQFEEQLRLIQACNDEHAQAKACTIGKNEQLTFTNHNRQLVQWQFINVSELYCLSNHLDGAELFSVITDVDDADSYIRLVNDKAACIQPTETRKQLNLV